MSEEKILKNKRKKRIVKIRWKKRTVKAKTKVINTIFILAALAAIYGAVITAIERRENSTKTYELYTLEQPNIQEVTYPSILVGTWRDDTISIFTRIFNADGTGSRNTDATNSHSDSSTPFEWFVSTDGRLVITYTDHIGNLPEQYYDFVINENVLTLYDEFRGISYIREDSFLDLEDLNISDEVRTIGLTTLEITDEFLLGNISIDEAIERLEELDEIDWENGEIGDLPVQIAISGIRLSMSASLMLGEPTDEDIELIASKRNSLAEFLDMPR